MSKQNNKTKVVMSVLIMLGFLSFSLSFKKQNVIAQAPNGSFEVYLPVVMTSQQDWLDMFNQYRAIAGLNPVTKNANYDYGLSLHIKYMLLNPTSNMHVEDPGNPGYTWEGADAGGQSNMIKLIGGTNLSVKDTIDLWMATTKHRYHMLHPDLLQSGYNLNCDKTNCFSGLNVLQGLSPKNTKTEVVFPGHNQVDVPKTAYPISMGFYPSDQIDSIQVSKAVLYDRSNKPVPGTITVMNDYFKQVIFTPNNYLLSNQKYRMEMSVTAGGENFSDTWYFTTRP